MLTTHKHLIFTLRVKDKCDQGVQKVIFKDKLN